MTSATAGTPTRLGPPAGQVKLMHRAKVYPVFDPRWRPAIEL